MLENVAVRIVQWEAKEVLSWVNYSMSKSSLPAKVLPWGLVPLPPSRPNLQRDSCVLFYRPLPEAGLPAPMPMTPMPSLQAGVIGFACPG